MNDDNRIIQNLWDLSKTVFMEKFIVFIWNKEEFKYNDISGKTGETCIKSIGYLIIWKNVRCQKVLANKI